MLAQADTWHRMSVGVLQGMVWNEVWPTCRGTPTWAATWRRMAVVMAVVAYRWLALNFTTTPCTHKDLNIWWLDNGTRYQSLWRCISHCEGASVTVMAYQSLWRCTVIVKVYQSLCRCTSYCEGVPITVIVKVYQSLWKCTSHCEGVPVTVKVYWSLWKCNHWKGVPVTVKVYWPLSGGVLVIVKAQESLWKLPRHVNVYSQSLWRCASYCEGVPVCECGDESAHCTH